MAQLRLGPPELKGKYRSQDGWTEFYEHASSSTNTPMRFSVFRPPQAETRSVPVMYWLSGLTCTEENFMTKSHAQASAAKFGVMIVAPDTSPRGEDVPDEKESWDFGSGAGFYLDATESPWKKNYKMESYVRSELPGIIHEFFPADPQRSSISGHSMGGHGALTLGIKAEGHYKAISAFAPIVAPMDCPWGQKAFANYLGSDKTQWEKYDTCRLIEKATTKQEIFVDQGLSDQFLETQLMPHRLKEACEKTGFPLHYRAHEGYDHSYYFISTFIGDHIEYHAERLYASS